MDAFCKLGSDGGLGEGRIWILLDPNTKRAKRDTPNNLTISELIGIDTTKMAYTRWEEVEENVPIGCGCREGPSPMGTPRFSLGDCWLFFNHEWCFQDVEILNNVSTSFYLH